MSFVWGVAFSKDIGAEKTPRSNSARCVSAVYAFLALVIVNTYCANLMAFLLQESPVLPISGVRDDKVGELPLQAIFGSILTNAVFIAQKDVVPLVRR